MNSMQAVQRGARCGDSFLILIWYGDSSGNAPLDEVVRYLVAIFLD